MSEPPGQCDVAVVGAGILGLGVARELGRRHPRLRICVLDREAEPARHQTGHNSGVIHAGIHYTPGSLKARLCVQGAARLYELCERRGIPHRRCGKLIVATDPVEADRLDELHRRGRANGVAGLRRLNRSAMAEVEPHARGIEALHSPNTGIVDFAAVARCFAEDVREADGQLMLGCEVTAVGAGARVAHLEHTRGQLRARHVVFCAGAWADRLAVAAGAPRDPVIVPFRGAYLRVGAQRESLVRALIYPVPNPALPFLGVHLTRHLDGGVTVGPTALLAGARDAYRLRRVSGRDLAATLSWPGTWRMFARWWRSGLVEIDHATRRRSLVRAAARLVPELGAQDLEPGFAGVRAQAVGRDGALVEDFVFSGTPRALHVRNAPSPAATASLAIAVLVADRAERELDLGR